MQQLVEKPWLKSYPPGIPATIDPEQYHSLIDFFEQAVARFDDKPAYDSFGTQLTYQAIDNHSRHFAAYLQQQCQLQRGQRVAIMLPNLLQYPVCLFGILRAGGTVVNINPLYTAPELLHLLNDSQAHIIIVLDNFAHTVAQILASTALKHVIVTHIGDLLPFPKSFIFNQVNRFIKKQVPPWQIQSAISFKDALKQGETAHYRALSLTPEDIALLQYTGGSTGIPKAAMLTHRNLLANIAQTVAWTQPLFKPGQEIFITAIPLYHVFAFTANCLLGTAIGGLNILIANPRDFSSLMKTLKKIPFTAITGVNTLFNAMLRHPDFASLDFSHLKIALAGGMALQESVAQQWQQITKKPILEAYGLTECSPAVCINPINLKNYNGSIGLPLPSTEITIAGNGELWIRGPQVMQAYWQKPEETREALTSDGWLKTGDIVRIDENGFVFLVDRKKDIIIVSGFNVYPNEVENAIALHPGVLEVGVVGIPDKASGEAVKACIVKSDPYLTDAALLNFLHERLTLYKIPKVIEFRDQLPKTNVGKILRRALR